jgi:class 3 adenylate cyclase/tetratricopeptide (TPR) repeat protein
VRTLGGASASAHPGERKLVTMLFADLSGYTALAESLDPEEVYTFLRPTMADLQTVVESFGGSVPQIMGDGFMAVFGVPIAHEDDAERAVRAALAVRDHVRVLNDGRAGLPFPQVHAGVNSGEVMVGPSHEAAGFAVVGDTVNTAARLADLAPPGRVVVDHTTWKRTRAAILYGPRRRRRAKGKAEPLTTYEALDVASTTLPMPPTHSFVDRDETLALLGSELDRAEREGRSRVLVITGEPGVGKSRLARELSHSLPPGRLFIGRCSPFRDQRRLAPLAEVVAAALGLAPGDLAGRNTVERVARRVGRGRQAAVAADLRALLGIDDPETSRRGDRDVIQAARLVIEDAARGGPVAVVLDDAQWADPSLVSMLVEARASPWDAPVLLLGLSREPIARLSPLPLGGLDDRSMHQLATHLLGGTEPDLIAPQVTRAGGNPLFLEETVGMLVERGAMQRRGDGWELVDRDVAGEVPTTIRLVIAARLDALPAEQKAVLQDASVCGSVTWGALLESVSEVSDARGALRALVERGLLQKAQRSTMSGTAAYEWKHELIRDVAYRSIPRIVRAGRHVQVAEWLRGWSPERREPVAAIAHQYERAWELSRGRTGPGPSDELARSATEYLTRRGEHVFARQARAAEPLFRRALQIADASGRAADPRVVARASVGLAEVLIEMGGHAEARDVAARARRLSERSGDDRVAARALLALGRAANDAGHARRARVLLEDAYERFEREGDRSGQAWALHRLSETWSWQEFERQVEDMRAAYRLFSRARDGFGRSVVAQDVAYLLSVQGGAEFRRWYERARHLAEDEGDLRSRAQLLRTWGYYCYESGRFTDAIRTMEEARPAAVEAGDGYAEADALAVGALAAANAGDPVYAGALAREALAIGRRLGSVRIPAMARLAIARASVRHGEPGTAGRAFRTARDTVRRRGMRVMHQDLGEAEAMMLLDRGAWGSVRVPVRALTKALAVVPVALWEPLPSLLGGRALLGSGAADQAYEPLDRACRVASRVGAAGTLELARGLRTQAALLAGRRAAPTEARDDADAEVIAIVLENRGLTLLRSDDIDESVRSFDLAIERWVALGLTSWLARALAMRADVLSARGDRARAAASRTRSRAVADQIRMPASERASIAYPLASLQL